MTSLPSLGAGGAGNIDHPKVPGSATLVYEVELLSLDAEGESVCHDEHRPLGIWDSVTAECHGEEGEYVCHDEDGQLRRAISRLLLAQ